MQVSCLERTTSSTASTLLKAGESHTAVDSNSNSAGGKSQVDKGAENLHCGTRDALRRKTVAAGTLELNRLDLGTELQAFVTGDK